MKTSKHESKTCPRCQQLFECRVGDIAHCQCSKIQLSEIAQDYIGKAYTGCLCIRCLKLLNQPLQLNLEKHHHFKNR